jgi:histidine triad (HIT) family protein
MNCEYCEIVERQREAEVLYEDDLIAVVVRDMVLSPGQITIMSKEHFTIMEMVPNNVMERCAVLANKVSVAVFDGLGSQGTNVLVANGLSGGQKTPHFAVEVIPRVENDGLNLHWEPKQLMEDEMEAVFAPLKEYGEKVVIEEPSISVAQEKEAKETKEKEAKDNYLIKSLRRKP